MTFTADVSAVAPGAGTPTGTVTFDVDGNPNDVALSGGTAEYATSSLSAGTHSVYPTYWGDGNFNACAGATLTQTVNGPTSWVLTASVATAPDPSQSQVISAGPAMVNLQDGGMVNQPVQLQANVSTSCNCSCGCQNNNAQAGTTPTNFSYSARTLNVQPIVTATLASDFCAGVPSQIQAQTDVERHAPGDGYLFKFHGARPRRRLLVAVAGERYGGDHRQLFLERDGSDHRRHDGL